jgi:hypothetical protein
MSEHTRVALVLILLAIGHTTSRLLRSETAWLSTDWVHNSHPQNPFASCCSRLTGQFLLRCRNVGPWRSHCEHHYHEYKTNCLSVGHDNRQTTKSQSEKPQHDRRECESVMYSAVFSLFIGNQTENCQIGQLPLAYSQWQDRTVQYRLV